MWYSDGPHEKQMELKVNKEDLQRVLDEGVVGDVAPEYLSIYLGEADWKQHINELIGRLSRRTSDKSVLASQIRSAVCCAILLPAIDRSTQVDPEHPENLLYKCMTYRQFKEHDWFELFKKVVAKDLAIRDWRNEAVSLGFVDPIDYHPNYRQAYNWLYQKAEEAGAVTPGTKDEIVRRFNNLVKVYGGAVICNIFTRNSGNLKRVVNWRSGYFFERLIFDVYTPDQVFSIKKAELARANSDLVRRVRV